MENKKIIIPLILTLSTFFVFSKEIGVVKNSKGFVFQNVGEEKEPLKKGDIIKDSFNVSLDRFSLLDVVLIDGKSEMSVVGNSEFSTNIFEISDQTVFRLNLNYGNFFIKTFQKNFQLKIFDTFIFLDSSYFFVDLTDSLAEIFIIYCKNFEVENEYGKLSGSKNEQIILRKGENPYKLESEKKISKPKIYNGENIIEIELENYKNDTIYVHIEN
ncbi:MAG: hypothetical protein ABIN39_03790 [candidate division WOR-3 bacterium]